MYKLIVLYPQPADVEQFEKDYAQHTILFRERSGIPEGETPFTVTKFQPMPQGVPPYYQMFTMPYSSMEELGAALASPQMQEVGADANRISTGGPVTILIGVDR